MATLWIYFWLYEWYFHDENQHFFVNQKRTNLISKCRKSLFFSLLQICYSRTARFLDETKSSRCKKRKKIWHWINIEKRENRRHTKHIISMACDVLCLADIRVHRLNELRLVMYSSAGAFFLYSFRFLKYFIFIYLYLHKSILFTWNLCHAIYLARCLTSFHFFL